MVDSDMPQMTSVILLMRFVFWLTKAKDTHTEYVILNYFARQEWIC